MIKSVRSNTEMFGLDREQLQPFEKFVLMVEGQLLEGMLFQNCIEQTFDDSTVAVTSNAVFGEEFALNLRLMYNAIEPKLTTVCGMGLCIE